MIHHGDTEKIVDSKLPDGHWSDRHRLRRMVVSLKAES
jgi:hypothetical protein